MNEDPPLIAAARSDAFSLLCQLLDQGEDPNQTNEVGETALVLATQRGFEKAVERLLKAGANPLLAGGDRKLKIPPIWWTFYQNNLHISQMLFDSIELNTTENISWCQCGNCDKGYFSFYDDIQFKKKNISYHPSMSDQIPPLIEATYQDDFSSFKSLLTNGADPHETLLNGLSCIHETIRFHRHQMFDLLLEHQVNINQNNSYSPLFTAVKFKNSYAYRKLIDLGARDIPRSEHYSALTAAVYLNDLPVIQELIALGSDLNQFAMSTFFTLVYIAARYGYFEVLQYLLSLGLHPDMQPEGDEYFNFGMTIGPPTPLTPLAVAVQNGDLKSVELLLNAGANPNRKSNGIPPLFFAMPRYRFPESETLDYQAIVKSYCAIIDLLIEFGAKVNLRSNNDSFCLKQAILLNQEEIALHLLNVGAKGDMKDKDGKSSIDYAKELNQNRVVNYLENNFRKMDAAEMQEEFIRTYLNKTLKSLGYQNHEETWWRDNGEFVQIFHLQNYPWNTPECVDFSFYLGTAPVGKSEYTYFDMTDPKPLETFLSIGGHPYKSHLGYTLNDQSDYKEFIRAIRADLKELR